MPPESLKARMRSWLERAELPMLLLAGLSIALYLAGLRGVWAERGLEPAYGLVMLVIDALFLLDLLAKVALLGRSYLASPWFLIDLLSTLPIAATLGSAPSYLADLRVLRELRVIRAIRALRMLRVVRTLRVLQPLQAPAEETPEGRAFNRALGLSVGVYTAAFLWLMNGVQARWGAGSPDAQAAEFAVVAASVLGMGVVLVACRYQIPDLSLRHIRGLLNLALPTQVAAHFMAHPESYDHAVRMPATIVFSDIRGFTRTVESQADDLGRVKEQLERVLDAIVEVHQRHDLIIDKFTGDCVMSFRGGDLVPGAPEEHAWRVVRASLDSLRAVEALRDNPFNRIKIGGASSPDCFIGTFGAAKRLSYTVLGDAVNLAARLEPACGAISARTLFCEKTYELAHGRPGILWRRVGELLVSGKDKTIRVYEALEPEDAGDGAWLESFSAALAAYEDRRFEQAREGFARADSLRPAGDGPARFYAQRCERLLAGGLPAGWKPVIELRK